MTEAEIRTKLDLIDKEVLVETFENGIVKGIFTNTESEIDTSSGEEEVELEVTLSNGRKVYVGIEFSAIKSMELA